MGQREDKMAKKVKKEKVANTEQLDGLRKSAKGLAITHELISTALHQGFRVLEIKDALDFIQSLHTQVVGQIEALEPKVEATVSEQQTKDETAVVL